MSMLRTALRLATSRAFLTDPVIGHICEDRVFDSRMSNMKPGEPMPVIIITTEESGGEAWSANNGGPPFDEKCKLTLEIALRSVEFDENGNPLGYGTPVTDKEMEAQLDLIEDRARFIIGLGQTPEAALVQKVVRRVTQYESDRFASDDVGEKLAMRLVHVYVELIGDDMDAREMPTGPFAVLPGQLRMVCEAMPDPSSQRQVCQLLAGAFPSLAAPKFLKGASFRPSTADGAPAEAPISTDFTFPGAT